MIVNVSEHHFNMSRHYFAVCVFLAHKEGFSQEHHCYRLIKIHTELCYVLIRLLHYNNPIEGLYFRFFLFV